MTRIAALVVGEFFCHASLLAQQTEKAELKLAVVVSRHGVRAPTWTPERLNQYSVAPWPDFGVGPGILTAHGRVLMKMMGGYYREYFAAQKLLAPSGCGDANRTYFWSDTDQRTMETARALMEGLLAGCKADVHSMPEGENDALFDPIAAEHAKYDPRMAVASVAGRIGPRLEVLLEAHRPAFEELVRVLTGGGKPKVSIFDEPMSLTANQTRVTLGGPIATASTFTENLLLEYANGMTGSQLGWGRLNAANLQRMMTLHTTYADLVRRTPYLARVRGSNLLSHIVRSLAQGVSGESVAGAVGPAGESLVVLSGHDTNLSNLSGMLRLSWLLPSYQADDAPPGGALIFSLWRVSGTGRYSVRLQVVAQTLDQMHGAVAVSVAHPPATADVFIPGCSTGAAGYPCDWEKFLRTAAEAMAPAFVQ